jgi:hypothetical protein
MSSFIQVRAKEAKKAKKAKKIDFAKTKSDIQTTRPFIKNLVGYVFYQCDTI